MPAISVRRFRGARLFPSGQKLSRGCGGSCGEPSAEASALYEDQYHVPGTMLIAEQASKPPVAVVAAFAWSSASLAANVPTCIVEDILYAGRSAVLYHPFQARSQPLSGLSRQQMPATASYGAQEARDLLGRQPARRPRPVIGLGPIQRRLHLRSA